MGGVTLSGDGKKEKAAASRRLFVASEQGHNQNNSGRGEVATPIHPPSQSRVNTPLTGKKILHNTSLYIIIIIFNNNL